jgi:hypothetical protein
MRQTKIFCGLILAGALAALEAEAAQQTPPDFSGLWAHPFLTGFEPPASGPGPVKNTARRRDGVANFQQLIGDHTNPVLKPAAAAAVKRHADITRSGGWYPTPSNQCWPSGVPYIFWDFSVLFLQQKDQIVLSYRQGSEVRRIWMNQTHPASVKPSYYGDSVGRFEGDTLVIDTIAMKKGPFAMVDMYGTPFSDKLHVVERYRLLDYDAAKDAIERNAKENSAALGNGADFDPNYRGKVLQLQFTVEDEEVFTTPWTATITYRPNTLPWSEQICAENPRDFDNNVSRIPVALKPDF